MNMHPGERNGVRYRASMPPRGLARPLLFATAFAACGGSPTTAMRPPRKPSVCEPEHLDVCELALRASLSAGGVDRALAGAYFDARTARDAGDAWAKVWASLPPGAKPDAPAVVIYEGVAKG